MAAPFNYAHMASVADGLIQKFGMKASLARAGVLRDCVVCVTEYMPSAAPTQLDNPTDRTVFISAGLGDVPATPPDFYLDQLVTYKQPMTNPPVQDEVLPFTSPLKKIAPAGLVAVWQTTVKR